MTTNTTARRERAHHQQAFQAYFTMGARRNYKAIAAQFNVSRSTIKNWSRWFRWSQRVAARQKYETQILANETDQAMAENADRAKKFLDHLIASMVKKLADGNLKSGPRDLLQLEKLKNRLIRWNSQGGSSTTQEVIYIFPDKGLGGQGQPVIPESQLKDYLQSIGRDLDVPEE